MFVQAEFALKKKRTLLKIKAPIYYPQQFGTSVLKRLCRLSGVLPLSFVCLGGGAFRIAEVRSNKLKLFRFHSGTEKHLIIIGFIFLIFVFGSRVPKASRRGGSFYGSDENDYGEATKNAPNELCTAKLELLFNNFILNQPTKLKKMVLVIVIKKRAQRKQNSDF